MMRVGRDLRAGAQHDPFDPSRRSAVLIQRMSSGTSVPEPRTWRSIEPRLTASIQTTARSTVGAAGFSFETPSEMPADHDHRGADVQNPANLLFPGL